MVGTSEGVAEKAAEVAKEQFEKMGFKVRLRLVTQDAMYTRSATRRRPTSRSARTSSWGKDFADAQTMLDPTFNGKNIVQQGNSNWPELNDPKINAAMDKAELLTDPQERADAWAKIDVMVTEAAPLVAWIWDKQALLRSADVNGAVSAFNSMWDLSWTSLK